MDLWLPEVKDGNGVEGRGVGVVTRREHKGDFW